MSVIVHKPIMKCYKCGGEADPVKLGFKCCVCGKEWAASRTGLKIIEEISDERC